MRIMATSDLHGNLEGLNPQGADVVVLAGDISPLRGRGPWHINDQKKWINKKFREWTESYPDIQFVVIPGNHDFYPIAHILFKEQEIDWKYEFSSNVHFLGDRGTEIDGVKFYGTPWVPIISYSWAFEGEPDTLKSWGGAVLGGKVGASLGSTGGMATAVALGQAGPQALLPEEIVSVPVFGFIGGAGGGLVGGISGFFFGALYSV